MREFIRIITEAEMHPLTREDLLESNILPLETVGYWVSSTGKIHPVEALHFQTIARVAGGSMNEAMGSGWIKVSTEDEFKAEFIAGCPNASALRSLLELAKRSSHSVYTLDAQWNGTAQRVMNLTESRRDRLFTISQLNVFETVDEFIHGVAQFLTERDAVIPWKLEDQALDQAFENIDWSSGTGDQYREWYASRHDIDNGDDVDIQSDDFKEFVKEDLSNHLNDAMWNIEERFQNGFIRCWRMITAPENWKLDARHPGIYWSWDKDHAEAHWGNYSNGHVQWLIEALIRHDQIDWVGTLAANADPSLGEEEKEIRLKGEVPVEVVSVEQVAR